MKSFVFILAVLVGAVVAKPKTISPDDLKQQNKDISSKEYLKRVFQHSVVSYVGSDAQDIVEKLQDLGLHEAATIAKQVDLKQIIRDNGIPPITLCMPSDKAVEKWRQELPERQMPEREILKNLVKAWIIPKRVMSSEVTNNQKIESLNGAKLRFNIYRDRDDVKVITINGARIVDADREFTKEVIQVVDKVIYPLPIGNVIEALNGNKAFSVIVDLLKQAGIVQELESDPITVIVPTNDAFQALPSGVLDDLKRDTDKLRNLLRYHVISDVRYSISLTSGQRIRASQGDEISVYRSTNDQIVLNVQNEQSESPIVISRDIPTTNGVIQVVDRVLLPPEKHYVLV
ncbi:transforming growth factor-beta-induced protein ig-h3-like [Lytechinus variegatus]|uniref:transforming growth factor-beta-induced protein ig-h3-like n=1 Tax=Lytechinus variegatus TaxID=7654 RepID=UPI001BB17558|nr:transforming growth factor-beta-induced protein ig-h3-like [Lytechinus variegatus]